MKVSRKRVPLDVVGRAHEEAVVAPRDVLGRLDRPRVEGLAARPGGPDAHVLIGPGSKHAVVGGVSRDDKPGEFAPMAVEREQRLVRNP